MSEPPPPDSTPARASPADGRLDSWKEIAAYLRRDVTTVQRWEKREGMPVHRHRHDKMGSVYAFRAELDAWVQGRRPDHASDPLTREEGEGVLAGPPTAEAPARRRGTPPLFALAAGAVLLAAALAWFAGRRDPLRRSPIEGAQIVKVTDFEGTEQAAALSRDGQFVAFLSDRDGRFDVWVTRIGTGQFYNLTPDAPRELVNPSVRTLGFSPDGTLVTFWSRRSAGSGAAEIGVWAVPLLGGAPRPYLDGAAEFDWTADGSRLVYHTTGAGDPTFVADRGQPLGGRHLFTAPPGLHSHFPLWSVDQAHVYVVQGTVPDGMDIWRLPAAGGAPERITHHRSHVSHPVFLDARTLVYLANDPGGAGPWLYGIDVDGRRARRLSSGLDRYTSLAASADGRRLVLTQATARSALWRVPIGDQPVGMPDARRITLTTGSGSSPRLGPDYLLYVVRSSVGDSLWKRQGEVTTELWSAPEARVIGAPAVDVEGRRIAWSVRDGPAGGTALWVMNADGTGPRVVVRPRELHGSPAWAPDGRAITSAVVEGGVPRLVNLSLDGGAATALVREHSGDPAWSPDGQFLVYSGPDIGTTFPVKAVRRDGGPHPLSAFTLPRGARRVRFVPGRQALVVMRGELRHKDLWLVDLATGAERRLTELPADFELRDFDLSPDGREVVLEQVRDESDVVQLDRVR